MADAITGTAPTKAQDTELDKVRKVLHAAVKNNKVKWKEAFAIFDINEKTGYDAELVAGIYLMTKNAKPEDAWIWAIQGIIAYNKINKKKTSDADIKLIRDLSEKTIVCKAPKNCAKLQTEMMEKAQYIFASKILTAISMIINSKEIQEMALGVFVRTAYKTYQDMEFYNPYEVEAACLKSGTDELSCFRMTYGGILGYALFGKQADDGVKIDQKSLDLQNRWKEEALKKFKCEDNEAKVCTRIVLKKP